MAFLAWLSFVKKYISPYHLNSLFLYKAMLKILTPEFHPSKKLAGIKCGCVQIIETQNKNFES